MSGTYAVPLERSVPLKLERHPAAPTRQPWREWAAEQGRNGPVAIDLFSGAGGLSLGLERAGYSVVLSVDHDESAIQTHLANFPGSALNIDLADPDRVDDLLELLAGMRIDLVAGGPPCQPFSRAGRSKIRDLVQRGARDPVDSRRELWRVMLRVVEATLPTAVLMENVPDMALGDDMRTVRFMAEQLEALGYDTDMRILEAWRYGVPQHRQRLMLVALRQGMFRWPEDQDPVTLRDAINDLPPLGTSTGRIRMPYRGPRTDFQRQARATVDAADAKVVYDHVTRPVRDDDRLAFRLMRRDTRYSQLPENLKRYRDDIFDDKYKRLDWDDWSRSITAHIAKDGYWYIHPQQHRTLTVREAARIQTFPDDFRFAGTRTDAFRLIGNAVPPRLGEVIARELIAATTRSPAGALRPRQRRAMIRRALLQWAHQDTPPAWRRPDDPWAVLLGVIAGRRCRDLGEELLRQYPSPASVPAASLIGEGSQDPIFARVARAARAVADRAWESPEWKRAAGVTAAEVRWVEAIGLGRRHVTATAATLRVAARISGDPTLSGVPARMQLARIIGHDDSSNKVLAALAGVGEDLCGPTVTRCPRCPLEAHCPSARTASDAGGR